METGGEGMVRIGAIGTSKRLCISDIRDVAKVRVVETTENRSELDSHADTCVLGNNFIIYSESGQTVTVAPYSDKYKPKTVAVASGGTAYDHDDGITYILDVHNGLNMTSELKVSLLNPNQMRSNGIVVDDVPLHLAQSDEATHSIYCPDIKLRMPLMMEGVVSYLPTRKPTPHEIENCEHIQLTGEEDWNPHSDDFASQEETVVKLRSRSLKLVSVDAIEGGFVPEIPSSGMDFVSRAYCEKGLLAGVERLEVMAVRSKTRKFTLSAEKLAQRWSISLESAQRTLQATTQRFIRSAMDPIDRRFRTQQTQFRYNRLNTRFYLDTMFSNLRSTRGNSCAQVFVNDFGFSKLIPMKSKGDAGLALDELFSDIGVPTMLHTDGAKELTGGRWKQVREKHGGIRQTLAEPYSPWQNRAESEIREVKRTTRRIMHKAKVPPRLWDYCLEYVSELRCRTALGLYALKGRTPYELVTGETPDISEWIEFSFYEPVWYHTADLFPGQRRNLGRWMGVSRNVGQAMCYWVLARTGEIVARSTVQHLTADELASPDVKAQLDDFDANVKRRLELGVHDIAIQNPVPERMIDVDEFEIEPFEAEAAQPEADDMDVDAYDKFISAQVLMPIGDTLRTGKVLKRKFDGDGNPVGRASSNPLLDTRVYEVEFQDGTVQEYAANLIAEAIFAQVDDEGKQFVLIDSIIDHAKDGTAVSRDDMYVEHAGNNRHMRRTTKGWKLLVQWKDGTTTWVSLKDLKESNPVEVAQYAVDNKIESEPAFAWWVRDLIRQKDRMIAKVKSKYWLRTHKFGIEVPKSVREALEIDRATGTDLWRRAIEKEMLNVKPAFQILEDDEKVPVGHQFIKCHMVFDIKMDFTRKARFVAGGHMTKAPASITYSSVVSRESVRIAFLIAALNGLEIRSADVGNAYLNADCREQVWMTAGPEFGSNEGKKVLIVRALYGLKSSGAAWRAHLAQSMLDIGFKPCLADPDVWMRPAVKPNGDKCYDYVLIYVDDLLVCSIDPDGIMSTLADVYRLKEDPKTKKKWDIPSHYLGANIGQYTIEGTGRPNGHWYMSSDDYVKAAVNNVETELAKNNEKLPSRADCVISPSYRPELDVSPLLDAAQANYYQNLIGVLRWAVELGRIDIFIAVSLLSQYLANPRQGHLDQVFRIFAYLKAHSRSKVVFDDTFIAWRNKFQQVNWEDFYPDAIEPMPSTMPEARGPEAQINCFVDANHAGNVVTRRSHTGVLIFLNKAPIVWYSKRQNTVESSTFGSKFVALKIATELVQGLRFKLRMMGVALDGPANIFCDNKSVVINSSVPESTLKKKHVSICYHRVREACAMGMVRIAHEGTHTNLADCLTKVLPGVTHAKLIKRILY
jgi:Reverse transcriptase (RNA-dependent DNA polymerase)